jgi:MipA family protein
LTRTAHARGIALLFSAWLLAPAANADNSAPLPESADSGRQPLWEVGIAGAVGTTPDYPASDEYQVRVLPFPYFVYRGNIFRSDENGARVRTQVQPNIELDVSGGASFASNSTTSGPRAGMPNLEYLLELGPNLKITLDRPAPGTRWLVDLPVRAVISSNWRDWGYQGLVFAPDIGFQDRHVLGSAWSGYFDIGPEFTTARYQQYFYQVDPQYALPDRPAYQAHGGYFGSFLELGLSRRLDHHLRVFGYSRLDDYAGSRSEDSPLFQTRMGYTAFVGVSWSFWQSTETVARLPDSF